MHPVGGGVAFSVQIGLTDTLWLSDGTASRTRPLMGLTGPDVAVRVLGNVSGTVFLAAKQPALGDELWGHTWRASRTVVGVKRTWSVKQARSGRIKVRVRVRASGVTPDGRATIWAKRRGKGLTEQQRRNRRVGTANVVDGAVTARIRKRLAPGRYRITARYAGSIEAAASRSAPRTIKVRR